MTLAVIALLASLLYALPVGASPKYDLNQARIREALQGLRRFTSSGSLADLHNTIGVLTGAVIYPRDLTVAERAGVRLAVVRAWSQVLAAIDTGYDARFDPRKLPIEELGSKCPVPPREADGRRVEVCASPSEIEDPQARAAYVAELQANERRHQEINYQAELDHLKDEVMSSIHANLEVLRVRAAPSNISAIGEVLKQAHILEAERQSIAEMVVETAPATDGPISSPGKIH